MNKEEYLIMTLNSERIKSIVSENFINKIVPLENATIKFVHRREWIN